MWDPESAACEPRKCMFGSSLCAFSVGLGVSCNNIAKHVWMFPKRIRGQACKCILGSSLNAFWGFGPPKP